MHWQLIWPSAKAVSVADAEVVFFLPRHWPLSFFNHFALFRTVYDKFYKLRLFLLLWPKGPLDLRMINIFYQSNCLSQTWNRCQASPIYDGLLAHLFYIYLFNVFFIPGRWRAHLDYNLSWQQRNWRIIGLTGLVYLQNMFTSKY